MKKACHIVALGILAFLVACSGKTTQNNVSTPTEPPKAITKAPEFNADSAYIYVAKQVAFGTRIPNTPPHFKCRDWMMAKLKSFGCEVIEQKFNAKNYANETYSLTNIIGSINPKAEKRILLAAHWDSRHVADQDSIDPNKPIDGANDGASGVGVLLEIARVINEAKQKPNVGIDILLLDGEDQGDPESANTTNKPAQGASWWCLGSQYWAKNKHKPNYNAYYGILLDMVGNKNARFFREGMSMRAAPSVVQSIWDIANSLGYSQFVSVDAEEIVDDHIFIIRDAGIPMVDIIEYDNTDLAYFSNTWHTHQDNMSNIDKVSLKAVGQTVLTTIYQP